MPSSNTIAAALLLTGLAAANPFTTIPVCPTATTIPACTITAQHQPVSTCVSATSSTCTGTDSTTCSTDYEYSTSLWVSTVIPCGWDGTTISSCTVTKTDQVVPCSASATTITSVVPITTGFPGYRNGSNVTTTYSTAYTTISKGWSAPYTKLGPLAIPGYEGCELCTDCAPKGDGSRSQFFDVSECASGDGKSSPECSKYTQNIVSTKATPAGSSPAVATNSMKTRVPSAGTYTFTFTNTAPAATITSGGSTYTQPAQPWFNYATRSCSGPSDFDFTVTVTKTIYVNVPFSTSTGASKTPVAASDAFHWGDWTAPASATATPSSTFTIPINGGSKYSKGDKFIGFPGGDDGAVVSGKGSAAQFYFDAEGNLMCNGKYVGTSTSAGFLVFELGSDKPSGSKFQVGPDGSFTLPGAGFCATDSTFFITFSGSPAGCKPVTCKAPGQSPSPVTTTTTTTSSSGGWGNWPSSTTFSTLTTPSGTTTTYSSTTTTTETPEGTTTPADPSADLDFPEATPAPKMRKRGGVLRKRME